MISKPLSVLQFLFLSPLLQFSDNWQSYALRYFRRMFMAKFATGVLCPSIPQVHSLYRTSLVAQLVNNLPAMQETWIRSLGQEDPLEKEMATHSSILAWRIPWTEEPGGLLSIGSHRVGHDWSDLACMHIHLYLGFGFSSSNFTLFLNSKQFYSRSS